jgi:two-component system NtrC family sensor kinase
MTVAYDKSVMRDKKLAGYSVPHQRQSDGTGLAFPLIFVLLTVGTIAGGWFHYRNVKRIHRTQVEHQLSVIADMKVAELVQWRKERMADAGTLFKNASIADLVRHVIEKPEDADAQRQLRVWFGKYGTHFIYNRVRLLDTHGVTRVSWPDRLSDPASIVIEHAADAFETRQVQLQDFYYNTDDQKVCLALLIPVLDEKDGSRPLGVIVLRIDPEQYLFSAINRWPTPSQTAETILVRREGNDVLYLNTLRLQTNTALNLRIPLDRITVPSVQAVLGREGIMNGIDHRGTPVVSALRTIPDTPWRLVVYIHTVEAYAPLRVQFWQIVVIVCIMIFGIGTGMGLIWWQQRSRFYFYEAAAASVLRKTEEKFRQMADNINDVFWISSPDFNTMYYVSPGCERIWGHSVESLYAHPHLWSEAILPAERERVIASLAELSGTTQSVSVEYRITCADSSIRWIHDRAFQVRDATGKVFRLTGIASDITERKQAEEMLRVREERVHSILTTAMDGFWLTDMQGHLLEVNDAYCRMSGFSALELLAMRIPDLEFAESAADTASHILKIVTQGEDRFESRHKRKDGSAFDVEVSVKCEPAYGGRFVAFVRDITASKKAVATIQESRGRYHDIVEGTADLITKVDVNGRITFVNNASSEVYGLTPEECIGRNAFDFIALEDREATRTAFRTWLMDTKLNFAHENRQVSIDGTLRSMMWTISAEHDESGSIVGFLSFARDITERKRMDEELRLSEARLRLSVRAANVGLWDWDMVADTVYFSPEWKSHIGYRDDEFPNRFEAWQNRLHPDDLARTLQTLQTYLAHPVDRHKDEFRLRHKDGTYRFIVSTADVLCDANGKPVRMLGGHLDITDRKETEARARDRNEEWKRTFDSISDMVSVHDSNFRILRVNQAFARTFGSKYAPGSIVGKYCFSTVHGLDEPIGTCPMCEALASRAVVTKEMFEPTLERYLEVTVSPVMDVGGEVMEIIHVVRDITERKRMELDLAQARKLESVGRLASGIAHEINTPIQYIGDHARFLKEGLADLVPLFAKYDELLAASRTGAPTRALAEEVVALQEKTDLEYFRRKAPSAVDHALEGVQRVATIVKAMKDFSHPGASEMSRTQLNRSIESTTIVCRNEWKYVADLQLDLDPALPPVSCLHGEINQVILNLVVNAAQAIGELQARTAEKETTKGLITISTRKEGGQVRISITDTGIGIAEEHKTKLFVPFFTTKEVGKGTGQGLSMAYNVIVKRHSGTIDFETEPGKGTTFNIRLPLEQKVAEGGKHE